MLETIHLAHIPPHLPIYITLYHSVQNAAFLRQQLLAGNSDFEYAFIDASMVWRNYSPSILQMVDIA
jgi:EKC/KEOPS complex subunit CGI121/TPRKB